jgi:hypothetical protein
VVPRLPEATFLTGTRPAVPEWNVQLCASVGADLIDEASDESFPASDPPATIATTGSVLSQRPESGSGSVAAGGLMSWLHDRSLTLVMLGLFGLFGAGQVLAGWSEYNSALQEHGRTAIGLAAYMSTGHVWEALFENWESEFLQMAAFVILTAVLYQKGSPESRRPGARELVDADPRDFTDQPDVPWPVQKGGWVLRMYENSLGLALLALFVFSWAGHAFSGWTAARHDAALHEVSAPGLAEYVSSSRFWFESFQNWQSEFLSVGVMVWLAVYLRQRGSPESKPVHAPHQETGR